MSFNTSVIFVTGYIGSDVTELRKDKKGKEYCTFSVGVVTAKHNSVWYQASVYGDLATNLISKNRIKKGLECMVRGLPSFYSFKNKSGELKPIFGIFADWVFIQERVITKEQMKDLAKANEIDHSVSDEQVSDLEDAPF